MGVAAGWESARLREPGRWRPHPVAGSVAGPADPAAAAEAGVRGDGRGTRGRASWEEPRDLGRQPGLEILVGAGALYPVAFAAPRPGVLVGQALLFSECECVAFYQDALPFVTFPAAAPAHHYRRQAARFGGAASQGCVTCAKEHQVV